LTEASSDADLAAKQITRFTKNEGNFSMPVVYTVFCAGRNIQFSRQYMETYFPASARPDQLLSVSVMSLHWMPHLKLLPLRHLTAWKQEISVT